MRCGSSETQRTFSYGTVYSPGASFFFVATQHFHSTRPEYLISVGGFYAAGGGEVGEEERGGCCCAGGKLILARDVLPLSITDVDNACELTTAMAGTAPSKTLTGKQPRAVMVSALQGVPFEGLVDSVNQATARAMSHRAYWC